METIPPHRKLLYASIVFAVIGVIATCFYAIDQATLYYLFKTEAQKDFEAAKSIIVSHQPFEAPVHEAIGPQSTTTSLDFGLRGSNPEKAPEIISPSWKLPDTKAVAITQALARQFHELELLIVNLPGRPLAVHPRDMTSERVSQLLSDPAAYEAWHSALDSGEQKVYTNFDWFEWKIPEFRTIIPYVNEENRVRGGFIFSTKPTLSAIVFLNAIAFGSTFAFLLVVVVALSSIMFAWKGLHDRWKTPKRSAFWHTTTRSPTCRTVPSFPMN